MKIFSSLTIIGYDYEYRKNKGIKSSIYKTMIDPSISYNIEIFPQSKYPSLYTFIKALDWLKRNHSISKKYRFFYRTNDEIFHHIIYKLYDVLCTYIWNCIRLISGYHLYYLQIELDKTVKKMSCCKPSSNRSIKYICYKMDMTEYFTDAICKKYNMYNYRQYN